MEFTTSEVGLANHLGISRATLREYRDQFLVQGTDWDQVGKSVMLTDAAVATVTSLAGQPVTGAPAMQSPPLDASEAPEGVNTAPGATDANGASVSLTVEALNPPVLPPPAEPVEMRVLRCNYANRQIISAVRLDGGPPVMVRVLDAAKFVVGMRIPARTQRDYWVLARPNPRYHGKW